MITLADASSWLVRLLFPPFLCVLCITLILASIGKSLGIRRLYVKTLVRVFEFAGKLAVEANREKQREYEAATSSSFTVGGQEDSSEESSSKSSSNATSSASSPSHLNPDKQLVNSADNDLTGNGNNGGGGVLRNAVNTTEEEVAYMRQQLRRMGRESRHNVISRKDNLILSPDRAPTIPGEDAAATAVGQQQQQHKLQNGEASEEENNGGERSPANSESQTAANDDVTDSSLTEKILSGKQVSATTFRREFELDDVLAYVKTGIASVIEDEVTQRFEAEELKCWNLLSRTSHSFEFVNVKLTIIWMLGFFLRYFVLLPGRFLILCVGLLWLAVCMTFIGKLDDRLAMKKKLYKTIYTSCFQILGGSLSAVITYHCPENKPKGGICVANHTSPIDVLILACDNAYDLIGQVHEGFLAYFQRTLSKCSSHIWFERSESKDRIKVQWKLREHVEDPEKLPILIFPEGTCINNTSVMQFKKGSFEVGGTIYPVAIKYDPLFGDAFWNSSKYGMMTYMLMMMTSWAIVCDVWYLPPMVRAEGEDAIAFANRVKAEIARQGGLVDLMWDGNLKRSSVKPAWKEKQQQAFSQRLKVE